MKTDNNLFGILMCILEYTEIHQDASNRYYTISKDGDMKVVFLVKDFNSESDMDLSVYTVSKKIEGSYELSFSKQDKQSLLRALNSRIRNKNTKKLSASDFDKIFAEIKKQYINANATKVDSIERHFAHSLRETFKDIPGKEKYINEEYVKRLFAQHMYASCNIIKEKPGNVR
jgi:hypothetical protein